MHWCRRFAACKRSLNLHGSPNFSPTVPPFAARISRTIADGGTWRLKWEHLKAGESNGKLPPRTCPGYSVPEPHRSHDWALVPAKPGLQGWILMNEYNIQCKQIHFILYTALYVQHNIEARSCTHCCSGKTQSISYSESRSLTYPACNAHRPYRDLVPAQFYSILPHYLIHVTGMIFEKKKKNFKWNMLWFSLQLLSETFLILRAIEHDMIKNVYWSSRKVHIILVRC